MSQALQAKSIKLGILWDSLLDGLIILGSDFIFVKLSRDKVGPNYSISEQFVMSRSDDLHEVFRTFERLAKGDD